MPSPLPSTHRRALLRAAAATGLGALAPLAGLSLAGAAKPGGPRLVLVILRGGLDGLSAVPTPGDPAFAEARGALGRFASPLLPLDGLMALHPALPGLHALYGQRELLVVHATGLPYRDRSHFDAQQVLESGGAMPFALDTGWLGRALAVSGHKGLALQTAVPLVLRGHADVDTWAPSNRPDPAPDLVARLERLYASDPPLAAALLRARELRLDGALPGLASGLPPPPASMGATGPSVATSPATSPGHSAGSMPGPLASAAPAMAAPGDAAALPAAPARPLVLTLARQAALFMAQPDGPQAAVLSLGGWDTHANQAGQGNETGPLAGNLRTLDAALAALREGLTSPAAGDTWRRTVVLVVTEFGRTVAINGTQGTDHGTGGAALVLGGAVQGGRVIADWPGLAPQQRNDGRDLRITTDVRALFKSVLTDHLGIASTRVSQQVLPGTAQLAPLPILRS